MRVLVAVSRDRSDLYFANELMRRVNVVGVLVENQWIEPRDVPARERLLRLLSHPLEMPARLFNALVFKYRQRFAIYNRPENLTDFGDFGLSLKPVDGCDVVYTRGVRRINDEEYVSWAKGLRPDVVAVCGTSLLKEEFLRIPRLGVLNLHGGLPQRYRGLNTTDWAVYNGEPEYVGATVHIVTPGIDDGDMVFQGRPDITRTDSPNDLYVKVVKLGVSMMQTAIEDLGSGNLRRAQLQERGKLYVGRDFTHRARLRTWRRYREGVVGDYLDNKQARDAAVDRIIRNDFRRLKG